MTSAINASRSSITSVSVRSDWIEAIRYSPCRRIDTVTPDELSGVAVPRLVDGSSHRVAELQLGLLDAALEVTDALHHAQVQADVDQSLRDLGRESRDDDLRAHETRGPDRLDKVIGD